MLSRSMESSNGGFSATPIPIRGAPSCSRLVTFAVPGVPVAEVADGELGAGRLRLDRVDQRLRVGDRGAVDGVITSPSRSLPADGPSAVTESTTTRSG